MNKGVINLYRYREVALASNRRYLDALAVVDDPAPAYRQVEELTEPVVVSGRSHAGFNPASPGDVGLFRAVLAGEKMRTASATPTSGWRCTATPRMATIAAVRAMRSAGCSSGCTCGG